MTTTVRSVRVQLDASVAGYIRDMKLAGSETDRAFHGIESRIARVNKGIGDLDGSTAGLARTSAEARVQQTGLSTSIDRTGKSANRAEASIDKYSGRLRTILGLVQLLGPAALRLAAGALPAISAGIVGIGAGAGAIGVTIAAVHGLSDALDALNKYELEPTAENLQALRIEQEKLGPSGAHFLQTLRDLEPELRDLQQISSAGVLPGFEASIDSLITRLPIVRQIVNRLSQEVGQLSADAGDALASDEWTPFFEYVRSQAAPILDDFARSAGNVALGLANILVAFDPLTQDFTGGLEDMTARFAEWSKHLEDDQGFQDFLNSVEEAGPELLDLAGAVVGLFTGLVRASAPLGQVTLPILTGIVSVLAAIANSKVGPVIYTAATAWLVYSRAASIAEKSTDRLSKSWDGMSAGQKAGRAAAGIALLATALTDYDDKAGLANTATLGLTAALAGAGPLGIGLAVTAGLLIDITQANDDLSDATRNAQTALNSTDTSQMREELIKLRDEIKETDDAADPGRFGLGKAEGLSGTIDFLGAQWSKLSGEQEQAGKTADELAAELNKPKDVLASTTPIIGGVINALDEGTHAAEQFSDALAKLNGWFDKRDAVRNYKDSIDALTKSLKDGFSREDAGNVDAIGRSILQVAELIKSPAKRAAFLSDARAQLQDMADHSGPKAAAAIQDVIDKFDSEGLTNPPPIKLTADQKAAEEAFANVRGDLHRLTQERAEPKIDADASGATTTVNGVKGLMRQLTATRATPKVDVDPGNSLGIIGAVQRALNNLHDRSITVGVNQLGGVTSSAGGHSTNTPGGADGMTVPGPRHPYGDKMTIKVAPGEEIISNRHGEADQFRSDRAAGRIPSYAAGGTVPTYTARYRGDPSWDMGGPSHFHAMDDAVDGVTKGLKGLEAQANKLQRTEDKVRTKRDALQSEYDSVFSRTVDQLKSDIFATSDAPANPWAAGAKPGGTMDPFSVLENDIAKATLQRQLVRQLKSRGLSQAALDAVTAEGLPALQQVAGYSDADLSRFQQLFTTRDQRVGVAAGDTAQAIVGQKLDTTNDHLGRIEDRLHDVEQAIHQANGDNKKAHKDSSSNFAAAVNGAAAAGHRRGQDR